MGEGPESTDAEGDWEIMDAVGIVAEACIPGTQGFRDAKESRRSRGPYISCVVVGDFVFVLALEYLYHPPCMENSVAMTGVLNIHGPAAQDVVARHFALGHLVCSREESL